MKKLLNIFTLFLLGLAPLALMGTQAVAQEEYSMSYEEYEEYNDWETTTDDLDYEYDYDYDDYTYDSDLTEEDAAAAAISLLFGGIFILIYLVMGAAFYIFYGITVMKIAKKLNMQNAWFAWVPVLNVVLMLQMGDKNPWLILLNFIPVIGNIIFFVISILATMRTCEKLGYDKMLGLLTLVPVANLVLYGVLAWGKGTATVKAEEPVQTA